MGDPSGTVLSCPVVPYSFMSFETKIDRRAAPRSTRQVHHSHCRNSNRRSACKDIKKPHGYALMTSTKGQRPPASLLRAQFHDFDELAQTVQGWDFHRQQLDRGKFTASVQQVGTASLSLGRFALGCQVHQRRSNPAGVLNFGFVGPEDADVKWCGETATNRDLMSFQSGGEYEAVSQPGFLGHTVSFSEELSHQAARALDLPQLESRLPASNEVLACDPSDLTALREGDPSGLRQDCCRSGGSVEHRVSARARSGDTRVGAERDCVGKKDETEDIV